MTYKIRITYAVAVDEERTDARERYEIIGHGIFNLLFILNSLKIYPQNSLQPRDNDTDS